MPSPCAVCLVQRPVMNRVGGLDVCNVCNHGGAAAAVAGRGWTLGSKYSTFRTKDDTIYTVRAQGRHTTSSGLNATFRMKQGMWALLGMFMGTSVGDPLFDKLVLARGTPADRLSRFLGGDGAQSALMDLVGEGGTITVRGPEVDVVVEARDMPDQARIESELAVLMTHLEGFGATA